MNAPQPDKSQTALLLGIMAGVIVLIGCAGVGAAYFLGYLGKDETAPSTPASMPMPGQQVTGTAPDVGLLPGETLVTTPPPPKSAIPPPAPPASKVAPPVPPAPKYTPPPPKAVTTAQPTPAPVKPLAPVQPRTTWTPPPPPKQFAQESAPPAPPPPPSPPIRSETTKARIVPPPVPHDYCVNCGVITSIAQRGDDWDVNVKFEDGSSQTLRYPEEPRFKVNQHVHLEDGRLVKD